LYEEGQPLVVTEIRQTPAACWPVELKCRSRMHYFLADRKAARIEPGARALMLDLEGSVTEASTANVVAWFQREGLVSPPRESILPGISVSVLEELAAQDGVAFRHRKLTVEDVARADELFLTSTSPCLLPVSRLNRQPVGAGRPGAMFHRLINAWSAQVGVDLIAQSRQFAQR
jgi:branched-subunit amino acid aminotransferase/4-amino-4-deoxychorismate lyase